MDGKPCVIDGELVALRRAVSMQGTPQPFAVRAARSSGKQNLAFPEEFGGRLRVEQACTVAAGSDALSAQYPNDTIVTSPVASTR